MGQIKNIKLHIVTDIKLSTKMPRGPKKHLKRLNAPKHWMLDKLSGNFAPRPSPGPHKLRECLPLAILLRNRLKYALNYTDVTKIMMQRLIQVDGRVRTDKTYPAGFMDVITIEKTGEFFRLLYDVKGRFICHRIGADEAGYKLCKVKKVSAGTGAIPYLVTHDARTIRRPGCYRHHHWEDHGSHQIRHGEHRNGDRGQKYR